jgi:hypothetical protein
VLVVVDVMARVAVAAVDEVEVIAVGHGDVPASVRVHVHVAGVGEVVPDQVDRAGVDVVLVDVVDVAVVKEVEVILVGHGDVPAVPVVGVRVQLPGDVTRLAHAQRHRSPDAGATQTMVPG